MEQVRIGIIGLGNMGSEHARYIADGKVPGARLGAVCDINPERLSMATRALGSEIKIFSNADDLFASGTVDAVIIAVPHYSHPAVAIQAFKAGLHVMTEKPAGVYIRQVREMNEAAAASGKVFGIMYNQRTNPLYKKLRELVKSGELGELKRSVWIITNWYRSQSYYNSGGWRATWKGEGGGVLINQCPHQLDLWQWICGMPIRVRAFCKFGRYHNIEVEDDVTAYVEYENGATGVFITTTGETPGTNRLELAGDHGKVVIEDGKLTFWRLRVPERQFNSEFTGGFGTPECWKCDIPVDGTESGHAGITADWVQAILKSTPLLAPGMEGINGLQISNAIHLSTWLDNWVGIPADEELYLKMLQERINNSMQDKKDNWQSLEMKGSFG